MVDRGKTQAATMAPVVDRQVVAELVARAEADGMAVDGEDGLLAQLMLAADPQLDLPTGVHEMTASALAGPRHSHTRIMNQKYEIVQAVGG